MRELESKMFWKTKVDSIMILCHRIGDVAGGQSCGWLCMLFLYFISWKIGRPWRDWQRGVAKFEQFIRWISLAMACMID